MATADRAWGFDASFRTDFGRIVQRTPREVVHARSEQDVVEAVERARRLGVGIAARGQGHSTAGQSLSDGGIMLSTGALDRVCIEGDTALASGGATWRAVVRAAWAHGLMPPVLTDYLGLSVAGTLAVGGVGGASFRHGTQTDHVVELRVVTGRGDVRTCSADRDPELFDACRAGLGQVGIVVQARLRLVPAPEMVRVTRLTYDALIPFLDDQVRLMQRGGVDELRGSISSASAARRYVIEAVQYLSGTRREVAPVSGIGAEPQLEISEHGFYEYAERLWQLEHHMRVTGLWQAHHPWCDVFLPGRSAREVIAQAVRELDRRNLTSNHVMVYPLRREPCRTPLLPIPADPYAFLFDVLPDESSAAALPKWTSFSRELWQHAQALGGRMYPIGYPVGTEDEDFPAHYGEQWDRVAAARRAHDPDRIFARGSHREQASPSSSLGELVERQLSAAGRALGALADAQLLTEIVRVLSDGWWNEPIQGGAAWPSDLTDDGTPFELSVQIESGSPELRVLVEPLRDPANVTASFEGALAIAGTLAARYGVDITPLRHVAPLFAPVAGNAPRFLLWYAVHLTPQGPLFKAYLNPEMHGLDRARELVEAALRRLGLEEAAPSLGAALDPGNRIPYFSVDLCAADRARAKVYVAHPHRSEQAIESAAIGSSNFRRGQILRWIQALADRSPTDEERPILTCHAFRHAAAAPEVTLHLPIRCHVTDDREALMLAQTLCRGEAGEHLERIVQALARRPLEAARGLITYLSLRPTPGGTRLTAYLAPQARAQTPVRQRACARVGDIRRAVELAQARYAKHPFFARMERGGTGAQVREVAHRLAFFIMAFQDMERAACDGCRDAGVATALQTHRREDMGHELWYLADLSRMELSRDLSEIFHSKHSEVRDLSYVLMSLLLRARHDVTRLAVVLALEGAGHEFFGRFVPMAQRSNAAEGLVFFGGIHQAAEAAHQADVWNDVFERLASPAEMREMSDAVNTTFEQMTRLAQHMEESLAQLGESLPTAAA